MTAALAGLFVTVIALAWVAPSASALHWCSPARITRSPTWGYVGDAVQFTYRFDNNIADALDIYSFRVTYSWDPTTWDLGSASVPGYGSHTFFDTERMPTSAGIYSVRFDVDGKAVGDLWTQTCSWSPGNLEARAIPPAPTVAASANPTSGTAPLLVSFTASVSDGLAPFSFAWAFGDGGTSSSQNPTHTYSAAGTYTAQVVVTDSRSRSSSDSVTITVIAPLAVDASADPVSGTIPLTVSFTATASGGTPPYSFRWDFGDGATSTAQNPTHEYRVAGSYVVTLTVTDSGGRVATKTLTVNASPSALLGSGEGVPPWVVFSIVGVVVAALLAAVVLRRRRAMHPFGPPQVPQGPRPPTPPSQ